MQIEFRSAYRHLLSLLTMTFLMACSGAANAVTPMIASTANYSIGLSSTGNVYGWGSDEYGQLGLGRLMRATTPQAVPGLNLGTGASNSRLALGVHHSVTVKSDGRVWSWGLNDSGQLGDGTTTNRSTPVPVSGLTDVAAVAAYSHTLALKSDGSVWTWGPNESGQLGDGTTSPRLSPVRVAGLTGVAAVAAGASVSLAVKSDGTVWTWGVGLLVDGSITTGRTPMQVAGLTGVVAVSAGTDHLLALKSDGSVWTWGYNDHGQLGDGTTTIRPAPLQVPGLTGVVALAAGFSHSVALTSNGVVWAWGNNGYGQLGDGTQTTRYSPVEVQRLTGVVAVAAGYFGSFAVKSDGTVWGCGENQWGALGNGTTNVSLVPIQVPGLTGVVRVAVGYGHTVVIKSDGSLLAWGRNNVGQLGDGTTTYHTLPVQVPGLGGVVVVAVGYGHTLAVKSDGSVWGWGQNYAGELGHTATNNPSAPVQVAGLNDVMAVAVGMYHTLVVKSDGSVWGLGYNFAGQLGDRIAVGASTGSVPVQVQGLSGVVAVAAGYGYSLALKSDGSVWGWGQNYDGALGDGTTKDRSTPGKVPGLTGVVAISEGNYAVKSDGSVWGWGQSFYGQLSDGTSAPRLSPVQVPGLTGVVAMATGDDHTLALTSDGGILALGHNGYGQLGDGTTTQRFSPVSVPGLTALVGVAAGQYRTLALKTDGTVFSWGNNNNGQLGDGTFAGRSAPSLVINETANGALDLLPGVPKHIPPGKIPPFFVQASGGIADTSASVSTTTKFNPADKGKPGSVYVTAMVPSGSLGATTIGDSPAKHVLAAATQAVASSSSCPATVNPLTLIQLTPTGWQTVVNSQLLPYASGVLGDQLAAQTILNNVDTTNLKGAEFCVGYGTSAQDMVNNGNIRAVATIPGATTTSTCVVGSTLSVGLNVTPGWNLLGNPINQSIAVASKFGDANKVSSVWKWDTVKANWQFYAPGLDATSLQKYVTSQGYGVLVEISPGDGYWVQAMVQADLGSMCGSSINLRQSSLSSGWNLVSTASPISAKDFNLTLSTTPPTAGQVPINMTSLWAWDANQSNWYFYAPSLDAQGGSVLSEYISRSNYKDFNNNGKTLGNGVGIWVNRP